MALVDRVKNILTNPNSEWNTIAAEPASLVGLISGYVAPLAGVSAAAAFIGMTLVGTTSLFGGTYRTPIFWGLCLALFTFIGAIVGVVILTLIINALAPTFGAQQDSAQAAKVAVYSYTPAWVAGVLQIIPMLGVLAVLGGLYGIYLLYLGLGRVMKSPADKTVGYTAVSVICAIVVAVVFSFTSMLFVGAGAAATAALSGSSGGSASPSSDVQYDKDSPMGRLQELSKKMEESGKKMDAAQKSGDSAAQVGAAMEGLGAIFGGGRKVDPLSIDQLKAFVPESFGGLPRTSASNERNGFAGITVTHSEATFSDGANKRIELDLSDSGGASGLIGLAGWAQMESSKEDDNGTERTYRDNGRMVLEKNAKSGQDEYSTVVGGRFVVSAKGNGVELADLKRAVASLPLDKLDALKDVGVQK